MDLHVRNSAVAALEQAIHCLWGPQQADALTELAWHLRQRDTRRARTLLNEAERLLASPKDEAPSSARARIALTRAECSWLCDPGEEARKQAAGALEQFAAAGDCEGVCDANLLLARMAFQFGEKAAELEACRLAREAAAAAGDSTREAFAAAAALWASRMVDHAMTKAELERLERDLLPQAPALEAQIRYLEGALVFQAGRFPESVDRLMRVETAAREFGLVELILAAELSRIGALSNLGDRQSAAQAGERSLALARRYGWPVQTGGALTVFGRLLAQMGQPERAIEMFREAQDQLACVRHSRNYATVCYYLGDALLALGRPAESLEPLGDADRIMRNLGFSAEVAAMLAVQAQAHCRLGQAAEARAAADAGLRLSREVGAKLWEAEALRSLAEIHLTHAPEGERSPRLALDCLEEALALIEGNGGHHEKSEVLTELALAHEKTGNLAAALACEREARVEQLNEENRRVANQVLAEQVRYQTERERLEAEHQRSLAEAEAERASALQASLDTLEKLRLVGHDIVSHLDAPGLVVALEQHLGRLVDVTFIAVFVANPAGGSLKRHAMEGGMIVPVRDLPIDHIQSFAAKVARERRELSIETADDGWTPTRIAGTRPTCSLWFGPLIHGERLMGVLSVQTATQHAYGEREKQIFRTVSGYAAVALANARTHGELAEKHERLAQTEAQMRLLATTDALTGLANRRHFFAGAESEFERARRYGGRIGFAIADIDRFKAINDTFGHPAGDRVIATVARVLMAQKRPNDLVGRIGGEEFAVLLPGASAEAACAVAERIRAELASTSIEWKGVPMQVSLSFGCAEIEPRSVEGEPTARSLERLVQDADAALYAAKESGRDRSMIYARTMKARVRAEAD